MYQFRPVPETSATCRGAGFCRVGQEIQLIRTKNGGPGDSARSASEYRSIRVFYDANREFSSLVALLDDSNLYQQVRLWVAVAASYC
jgi:hypothetical protein